MLPKILTEAERLKYFQELNDAAARLLENSARNEVQGILILHQIREDALYTAAGYETWENYIDDFRAHHGISRALLFKNLACVRLAAGAGFTPVDIESYGLYTLRPFFDTGKRGPIKKYNRRTGEIKGVTAKIEAEIGNGNKSEGYGKWVKNNITEGAPASVSNAVLREYIRPFAISFFPIREHGEVCGVEWYIEGEFDGRKRGYLRDMPDVVRDEFFKRIGYYG
jgi:hypothetical protein